MNQYFQISFKAFKILWFSEWLLPTPHEILTLSLTKVTIIWKPVHLLVEKINGLLSISKGLPSWSFKELSMKSCSSFKFSKSILSSSLKALQASKFKFDSPVAFALALFKYLFYLVLRIICYWWHSKKLWRFANISSQY